MPKQKVSPRGMLVVSIDFPQPEGFNSQGAAAAELVEVFGRHELPATWAIPQPAEASLVLPRLSAAPLAHEVALLGEAHWAGPEAGRNDLHRELTQRMSAAQAAGWSVTTLVAERTEWRRDLDLLVKHGISAVRGKTRRGQPHVQPRTPHFGLWEISAGVRLSGERGWLFGQSSKARRGVASASAGHVFHVAIDGPRLMSAGRAARRQLEGLLRFASEQRERGQLDVLTLAETAQRLSFKPKVEPAHSILRKAG